jgi:Calx-beta domain/Divergent InlB B-repeat domain
MRIVLGVVLLLCFAGAAGGARGVTTLHVFVSGNGTVTSSPPGINCPTECAEQFDSGSRVTLEAQPAPGDAFLGWGGACSSSTTTCTVVMDVPKNVAAKFTPGTLPALSIDDVTTHETNVDTVAVLTVTLAPESPDTVTLHYASADGTADSTDYVGDAGTLRFPPGTTSVRIPVLIKGDALDEPDETLFVDLSSPEHATISRGRGTVTIVDDDPAPFRLLDAFVDVRWSVHRRYTKVTRFVVHRPAGAAVKVRCRGQGCPVRVGAELSPGAVVDVRVTMPYQPLIGRVFQYRIRASKRPRVTALCLPPGALKPVRC